MKIDLPLSTTSGWIVLPAEIVDVAPHLADLGTFAVHKQTEAIRFRPRGWALSNVETGSSVIACDADTRIGCLRKAKAYLAATSRADMARALNDSKR